MPSKCKLCGLQFQPGQTHQVKRPAGGQWTRAQTPTGWLFAQSKTYCAVCLVRVQQEVQGAVVQHHFARGEVREINKSGNASDLKIKTIAEIRAYEERMKIVFQASGVNKGLLENRKHYRNRKQSQYDDQFNAHAAETYDKMLRRLQSADLTINLKAASWFSVPNLYNSYAQIYERNIDSFTFRGDPKNSAGDRIQADNRATFRAGLLDDPRYEGVRRYMDVGQFQANDLDATISNAKFNPKTRQVFAALNYGRREHSFIAWGKTFLVLNPKFKINALYLLGDTFIEVLKNARENAVSYDTLAAIFYWAGQSDYSKNSQKPLFKHNLQGELYKACAQQQNLPDMVASDYVSVIEAHIFSDMPFHEGVVELRLSREEVDNARAEAPDVFQNAQDFANKHGLKLVMIN